MSKPAYMNEDWFVRGLMREVRASSITRVASMLGVKRVTLSIFVNGQGEYGTGKAKPDRMKARYLQAFEGIPCSFEGRVVDVDHCREQALQRAPIHNPMKLEHWRACKACPHHPVEEGLNNGKACCHQYGTTNDQSAVAAYCTTTCSDDSDAD